MDNTEAMEATRKQQQINRHGNLITAFNDQALKDIFHQIRTSKSPAVINFGASWEYHLEPNIEIRVFNCLWDYETKLEDKIKMQKVVLRDLSNLSSSVEGTVGPLLHPDCWCRVCAEILPSFNQLSNKFPRLSFVYADIDECPETTQHIRYTPTFHFYRDGERVDAMFGAGEERLHDRLWLHS